MSSWCKESGRSLLYDKGSSHVRRVHSLTELLLFSTYGVVFFFLLKVKYSFIKVPIVQIFLQEDLYACSWNSVEADEALHAAGCTCVWQDCGQSSLARDLRRKCSSFKWEDAVLFLLMCIYKARDGLLLEKNFGISLVRSISCHSVIWV